MNAVVSALFCCDSSPYRSIPGVDVFDVLRDARSFDLSTPVVAHPPCRAWGKLSYFAKPRHDERDLAIWAMWVVRHCGGVLEHPMTSRLWSFFGVRPGCRDDFGGLLVPVDQVDFGHRAQKRTGLYCVGCSVRPGWGGVPTLSVERMPHAEREQTPPALASILVEAARSVCF